MKLNIKKFQFGGEFASLAIGYTPTSPQTTAGAYAPAIAESSQASSRNSSSSKDDISIKDVLKVFEGVKGLPIDVDYVINDFKQMFQDDILFGISGKPSYSNLVNYYLHNVNRFNALRRGEETYDKVREQLVANNSLDEIAIDRHGRVLVTNEKGDLDAVTLEELKKGDYKALSNRDLLDIRQTKLPFGDKIYNNMTGVGMEDVIKKINSVAHSFGTSEKKLEGYTVKQSDAIKSGLSALQEAQGLEASAMTVDGLYKNSVITKDQKQQAKYAMQAIYNSLTPQEKTLLSIHSQGGDPTETISNIVLSRTSNIFNFDTEYQASLNADGSKKESSSTKEDKEGNDNPLTQMLEQKGGLPSVLKFITKEGEFSMNIPGTQYPMLNKVNGDMSINQMLQVSGIAGITQGFGGITMGDQRIPFENLKDIMYENQGGQVAVLPATTDQLGNKVVDLSIMDDYNEIVRSIEAPQGSEAWNRELAKGLKAKGLDQYLQGSDTLDSRRFGLFLMVNGYTTDRWKFNKDSKYVEQITPTKELEQRMSTALSIDKDNKNYKVDIDDWGLGWIAEGSYDDIYRGTVYIPLNPNRNAAVSAYGSTVSHQVGQLYERNYQDILSGKVDQQKDTSSDILNEQ